MKIREEILQLKNPEKAKVSQRFFKTGKWEYGEWDIFLGLTVPQTRGLVKKFASKLTLDNVDTLLADKHHEVRLAGCLVLVYFAQKKIYPIEELARFYMQHVSGINNWDLIDGTSEQYYWTFYSEFSLAWRASRLYHTMYREFKPLD